MGKTRIPLQAECFLMTQTAKTNVLVRNIVETSNGIPCLALGGLDGSLLAPPRVASSEAFSAIDAQLEPLLRRIKLARLRAGCSLANVNVNVYLFFSVTGFTPLESSGLPTSWGRLCHHTMRPKPPIQRTLSPPPGSVHIADTLGALCILIPRISPPLQGTIEQSIPTFHATDNYRGQRFKRLQVPCFVARATFADFRTHSR